MKILIGMPSKDSWGGPIASEPPFVGALRDLGVSVTEEVYVFGDKGEPTPFFRRIQRVIGTAFNLRCVLKSDDFDLIHFNTSFDKKTILRDSLSLFFLGTKRPKVFFKFHGSGAEELVNTSFLYRKLIEYIKKRVDGYGVFSSEEMSNFRQIGFDQNKLFFVKNAITIGAEPAEDRARPTQYETPRILFVSRFIPTKGLIETIQACAIIRDLKFNFVLTCVGDGETARPAKREVERLHLTDQVEFTGYISEDEVARHYFESDIFVFPTRHIEGFPIVLFKAVAAGLPIVTTNIRAAKDYLAENENCLFSTQDPANIAEKLARLIEDKPLRESMSEKNIDLGKTLLPDKIAEEYLAIYEKICARSS
ncbi:MAG: glycosyltransferase family 4 protein [Pyrinomonadaceae bacterium]